VERLMLGSRVVVAAVLVSLAAWSPVAEAQYFRQGLFGKGARGSAYRSPGGNAPSTFSAYAYPSYRGEAADALASHTATYRTLCVRLCDGFYFPISFATRGNGLARDAEQCTASCGLEARLFYHPNPGGSVEGMTDLLGRAYSALPTAFTYRKTLVTGCSCRPPAPAVAADGMLGPAKPERSVGRTNAPELSIGTPEAIDLGDDSGSQRVLERPAPINRELDRPPAGHSSLFRNPPISRFRVPGSER
jgi:Protein of unknown function (DUF2865)